MDTSANVYFFIVPVVVFGPLFLWIFYTFGIKELIKIPEEMRRKRRRDVQAAADFQAERLRKRGTEAVGLVRGPNTTAFGFFMQGLTFLWFATLIGFFASSPPYLYADPGAGLIKLSLSHAGQRRLSCSKKSAAELAKLEPNMRARQSCPRERWPVYIELELDNHKLFARSAKPAGLSRDGPSSFYQKFSVATGKHRLTLRLRDTDTSGFGFVTTRDLEILSGQVIAVQFNAAKGGFRVSVPTLNEEQS